MGDDFEGEFQVIVMGEFGPFETKADERWTSSWTKALDEINSPAIDTAVEKAPEILKKADLAKLSPDERLMLGQALLLGGHLDDAQQVLVGAAKEAGKDNPSLAQWIWCSAAWAAWLGHDEAKLKQATDQVFAVVEADRAKRDDWNMRHWCAAWLLGSVTADEFVTGCTQPPWDAGALFFVAERPFRDGNLDEAKAAYKRCLKQCEERGGYLFLGWAEWRLKQLEAKRPEKVQ